MALSPALWLFTGVDGVVPANNHAERILRNGVPWRKNALECHSAEERRFVERMLTVVQTLRLQDRLVLDNLERAISRPSIRPSRPASTGPSRELNGYQQCSEAKDRYPSAGRESNMRP